MISETVVKAIERGAEKASSSSLAGSDAVVKAIERGFDRLSDDVTSGSDAVVTAVSSAADKIVKAIRKASKSKSGGGGGGGVTGMMSSTASPKGMPGPTPNMVAASTALIGVWSTVIGKTKTLRSKTQQLSKVMSKTTKVVGKAIVPAFRLVANVLIALFKGFNRLPDSVRTFVSMAFALVSALTILATVGMSLGVALLGVKAALGVVASTLGLTLGPLLALIAAAAALYAAWTTNFLGIKTKTKAVVKFLFGLFKSFAKVTLSVFLGIAKSMMKVWKTAFNLVIGLVRSYLKLVVKQIMRFAQYLTQLWTGVKQMLSGQWKKGLKTMGTATVSFVADMLKIWVDFGSQIIGAIAKVVARGVTEFERLWDLLIAGGKSGANALVSVVESSLNGVLGTIDQFLSNVEGAVNSAIETANKVPGVSFGKVSFGSVGRVSIDGLGKAKSDQGIDQSAEERYKRRASQIDELTKSFADGISKKFLSPDFGKESKTKKQDPSAVLPMLDKKLSGLFGLGPGKAKSPLKGVTADELLGGLGSLLGGKSGDPKSSKSAPRSGESGQSPPNMGPGQTPLPASGIGSTQKEANEINIDSIDIRTRARAPTTQRDTERLAKDIGQEFSAQLGRRS